MFHRWSLSLLAFLLTTSSLLANPPEASYIFPAGGQRGKTVPVKVGGLFLYEKCGFQMLGTGIHAPSQLRRTKTIWFEGPLLPMPASQRGENYPKDMAGEIRIAPTAELGLGHWRVWTSEGNTSAKKFVVGHLPEIVEQEIDGSPVPVDVSLPITVNGRIFPRTDVDIWSFHAKKGETITCVVQASRLGTPLDALLDIRDPQGRRLTENDDTHGADPFVRFTAPTDGHYQVRIRDTRFTGGQAYVYRLTINTGPYVDHIFPLGGKRGTQVRLQLTGQGLPNKPVTISLPKTNATSHQQTLMIAGQRTNTFALKVDDLPEYVTRLKTPITLPAIMNGRILQPGHVDSWSWTAKKGDTCEFDLHAARLGTPLDGVLTIYNSDGKQLARAETSAKQIDPILRYKVPADGVYTIKVSERLRSRSGPAFAYRLRAVRDSGPDFRLDLPSDTITVPRKGKAKLKILVERVGGFRQPIELKIDGLPKGVTVKGTTIAKNRNNATLQIEVNDTAKIGRFPLSISGSAMIEGKIVTRLARHTITPTNGNRVVLAVAASAPFKIKGNYKLGYAARGGVHLREYFIERNGYTGPIEVSLADRQARHLQGVTGPTVIVPAGTTKFTYPVKMPPWMELGRTCRVCVMGVATIKDNDGTLHRVSHSSTATNEQFIAITDPCLLAMTLQRSSVRVRPAQTIRVPVRIKRSPALKGPAKLELIVPAHVTGIRSLNSTIAAGNHQGEFVIQTDRDLSGPFNMPLVVRATILQNKRSVFAEAKLDIVATEIAPIQSARKKKTPTGLAAYDAKITDADRKHWAYQPLPRVSIPRLKNTTWPRNPIDAFVLTKLQEQGWTPAASAKPHALLRRVFLDVTGLPPTLEEQDRFLSSTAPDRWERLVDDLLSRPAYGERWGRHWLDLVRYAETNGYERDAAKPYVWRYRDYVIRAFNHDKPFNRFILEQIAGDELADANFDSMIATGFHRLGPWDDEPADPKEDRFDQLDDIVRTTSQVFLGLTMGCARCHDHKFDALTMHDYYRFVAIFNPLQRPRKGRTELVLPAVPRQQLPRISPENKKQLPRGYFMHEPSAKPPTTHLLIRGKASRLGPQVQPGFPAVLVKQQPKFLPSGSLTSLRRLTLAKWITNPQNPLTARVIVNRVWQYHFGRGLVGTPSDFGVMGQSPSHPQLLDWLAGEFIRHGWSLKKLHRLILTSNTYRMSKTFRADYAKVDPENRYLWRFPYRRLEVEAIRDSMLAVSGQLNRKMTGPSMYPEVPKESLKGNSDPGKIWKPFNEHEASRRTVYAFLKRSFIVPFLETLDLCDTAQSTDKRLTTTVAPQALTMFNGGFVNRQARHFAKRLRDEVGEDAKTQIEQAYRLALCRPPTTKEVEILISFLNQETQQLRRATKQQLSTNECRERALVQMCRVLFNMNEFVYVD